MRPPYGFCPECGTVMSDAQWIRPRNLEVEICPNCGWEGAGLPMEDMNDLMIVGCCATMEEEVASGDNGMTVDEDGDVYITHWKVGPVVRIDFCPWCGKRIRIMKRSWLRG